LVSLQLGWDPAILMPTVPVGGFEEKKEQVLLQPATKTISRSAAKNTIFL